MIRPPNRSLVFLGFCVLVTAASLLTLHPVTTAEGGTPVPTVYLDIDAPPIPGVGWQIPPDCSVWHELWPSFCQPHHQFRYEDNDQSGTVTVCDNIVEDPAIGACWHIDQVTPTYFLSSPAGLPIVLEPTVINPQPNPVCEVWHEIHPQFCQTWHVDQWQDSNGSGVVDACDVVVLNGAPYHVDRVGCDVTASFSPATGTKHSTWGWLKSLFK